VPCSAEVRLEREPITETNLDAATREPKISDAEHRARAPRGGAADRYGAVVVSLGRPVRLEEAVAMMPSRVDNRLL
jgi:hypothetical protein